MNLVSRLDDYLNHEVTHTTPITVTQTPRMFQDKRDSPLLDMALRGLLKERMYGNLQNFQTENISNKNHLKVKAISALNKRNHLSSLQQVGVQKNQSFSKKLDHQSFILRKSQKSGEIQRKAKTSPKKHLSEFSSSINIHLKQKHCRKLSDKRVQFSDDIISQQDKYLEANNGVGFISEVQHLQGSDVVSLAKNNGKRITLPQISDRRKKTKNSRAQHVKIAKSLFTQHEPKITVRDDFWQLICSRRPRRPKRSKQAPIHIIQSSQNPLDESINISSRKRSISITNGDGIEPRRTDVLKYNQNLTLRRESFQNFIGSERLTITGFVGSVLAFFQMLNKFTDRISKSQFESIFTSLYNQSNRAWCFAVFQFLDSNTNGKIDSSDLFKVYNAVDSSKSVIEKFLDSSKMITQRENLYVVNESSRKKQIMIKRQKTVSSYNGSCSNRTTARVSVQKPIKIYRFDTNEQNLQPIQTSIIKDNYQNIISFQKQLQALNQKMMIARNLPVKSQNHSQNPESASANKSATEKCYLEQGLLDRKDVRVSQLGSILSEISPENGAKTRKVLDTDHKKLNVKLTSAYLQTFIATNHNEETRTNREFLQNLKDKVKKISKSRAELSPIQTQNVPFSIEYRQFYEESHFLPFKRLFFALMQVLVQNK